MDIAGRHGALEIRRREQHLGALALIETAWADIGDGELPGVDDLTVEASVGACDWKLEHGWSFA